MIAAGAVRDRLEQARARIADAGGHPDDVTVVAVTKGFGPEAVRAALAAGVVDIGESYAQELVGKSAATEPGIRWHFLGHPQRNKLTSIAELVHLWHAVDTMRVAEALARRVARPVVLVQVNVSGEPQKFGCAPAETPELVRRLRSSGLDVRGLMAVGPTGPPEAARPGFRLLAAIADDLALAERSMGMSDDLEVAVQEGATIVRLGRALFGPRPAPEKARR